MKILLLAILSMHIFVACERKPDLKDKEVQKAPMEDETVRAAVEQSRNLTKSLLGNVREVLMRHMSAGGPTYAISACADTAQLLTEKFQKEHNISIRRVSMKWRNAKNIPDEYEARVLEHFAALAAEGKLDATTEHVEVINDSTLRFMQPIMFLSMCLPCHGGPAQINKDVQKVLRERYPEDKATGYRPGELRGAVSVIMPLKRSQ